MILLTPHNINAPAIQYYNAASSTTNLTVDTATTAAAFTEYVYKYQVIE